MRFWVFEIFFLMPLSLLAQLTAPESNSVRYTSYPSAPDVKDSIFIYCNTSGVQKGSLIAANIKGTGPYDFSWYKWDNATNSFSILFKKESDVMTSTADNLEEGGYKVNISGGFDTSFVGWIHIDKPSAEARLDFRDCDRVILYGKAGLDTFYYNDIVSGKFIRLINKINSTWSSNPASIIYPFSGFPNLYRPTKLPYEDVTYKLTAIDDFGCQNEASFFYEPIHVRADAKVDPATGEAPLEVVFTDKSIRGSIYEWNFGDSTKSTLKDPEPHIYNKPGRYYPKLKIESDLHCIDYKQLDSIYVEPSKLDIPNAFSPDEDGYNDRFMVYAKSLRYLSVEVFSRSGLKVYGFSGEGEKLKEWQGWDGRINNSSIDARPGIYFYIIRAFGWDDVKYDSKEYRGFLYLYR